MEVNLTRLKKTIKHVILAYLTIDWDIVVNANIFLPLVNKTWLEWLYIAITKLFRDLIHGYIKKGRIIVYYIWQERKHILINIIKS